jgi:SAM-dependent methyltransferase
MRSCIFKRLETKIIVFSKSLLIAMVNWKLVIVESIRYVNLRRNYGKCGRRSSKRAIINISTRKVLSMLGRMNQTTNVFDEMGALWAEIADRNHTELQLAFLKNQLKLDGYILDVACGNGRHLSPLTSAGYDIIGLDTSLSLLRIAKHRNADAEFVRGDMRFLPFKEETFQAAISMDTSFGYLPSKKDDLQSLQEVHRVIRKTGLLILDVFNYEQLTDKYRHRGFSKRLKWVALPALLRLRLKWFIFRFFKWREYPSFLLLQRRSISRDGGNLRDLWVISTKRTGRFMCFMHEVRLYERRPLVDMLAKAGFMVNRVFGGYEGQMFSHDANRLIISAIVRVNV